MSCFRGSSCEGGYVCSALLKLRCVSGRKTAEGGKTRTQAKCSPCARPRYVPTLFAALLSRSLIIPWHFCHRCCGHVSRRPRGAGRSFLLSSRGRDTCPGADLSVVLGTSTRLHALSDLGVGDETAWTQRNQHALYLVVGAVFLFALCWRSRLCLWNAGVRVGCLSGEN